MSFPSRSSLKPTQAILLGISATLIGAVSHAGDDTHFTLTAYANATGGQEILSGDYQAALGRINARKNVSQLDLTAVELNRCVALTMAQQWPAARLACNAAVREAEHQQVALPTWALQQRRSQVETVAVAYSNRAVLKWLTQDASAATQDLARARALSPESDAIAHNSTALASHSSVAQVASAPQR